MVHDLLILGTGGNSIDILETVVAINALGAAGSFRPIGFLDDAASMRGQVVNGLPVLGSLLDAKHYADAALVNGIGSVNNFRDKPEIIAKAANDDRRFVTLVHPSASVSPSAELSAGTVVLQNATIANQVTIGGQVIVLPNTVLSHGVTIGAYTCIAGGVVVCGEVLVGRGCYIGAGTVIRERLTMGDGCLIGMGSVVVDDVAAQTTVYGNPAS